MVDVQSPSQEQERLSFRGKLLALGAFIGGLGLLAIAAALTGWEQNVLIEIGGALMLFAPLFLLQRQLTTQVRGVETRVETVDRRVDVAEKKADEAAESVTNLAHELRTRHEASAEGAKNALVAVREAPTVENLAALIRSLRRRNLISTRARGRFPPNHGDLRLVIALAEDPKPEEDPIDDLRVWLSEASIFGMPPGERTSETYPPSVRWSARPSGPELTDILATVREAAIGAQVPVSEEAISAAYADWLDLCQTLVEALEQGKPLHPAVELASGPWLITTAGLEHLGPQQKVFDRSALNSPIAHEKWIENKQAFEEAFEAARAVLA